MLLRIEVTQEGQPPLPPIHLESPFVIGSSPDARVRLPAPIADPAHVRVEGGRYIVGGESHDIGEMATLAIGSYRITLAPAAPGETATPPKRTESLARELVRNLLGTAGAPTLEITRGPLAGAKRSLPPPESTLVIGRGDEASWIIADNDLSRTHAELRRTWDGTFIVDLGSKNGTKVDGKRIAEETSLHDGAQIELGKLAFVFRDPAASHPLLAPGTATRSARPPGPGQGQGDPRAETAARATTWPFYAAVAIMMLALGGFVWVVTS